MITKIKLLWYLKFWDNSWSKIQWFFGARKFEHKWRRCKQHNNCWVKFYDEHFRPIKHQIVSMGWTSNMDTDTGRFDVG